MDLEEHTGVETATDRCEECGVKLTPRELELALENGGPVLCSTHAAEIAPLAEDVTGEPDV
jgi:hypothetical protein